jgi:hypothetical protein
VRSDAVYLTAVEPLAAYRRLEPSPVEVIDELATRIELLDFEPAALEEGIPNLGAASS